MLISVVIPAFNEEKSILTAIKSVQTSFYEVNHPDYEIIVANDDSTDQTAYLAEQAGARVVFSGKRNIGATRNTGARHAKGEFIIFMDADTVLNDATLKATITAINSGFIGGGALMAWDKNVRLTAHFSIMLWRIASKIFILPSGGYFFVKKNVFEEAGGFNEEFFVSEELLLAKELKKIGRLTILNQRITTSARKFDDYRIRNIAWFMVSSLLSPVKTMKDRTKLWMWYEHRK